MPEGQVGGQISPRDVFQALPQLLLAQRRQNELAVSEITLSSSVPGSAISTERSKLASSSTPSPLGSKRCAVAARRAAALNSATRSPTPARHALAKGQHYRWRPAVKVWVSPLIVLTTPIEPGGTTRVLSKWPLKRLIGSGRPIMALFSGQAGQLDRA